MVASILTGNAGRKLAETVETPKARTFPATILLFAQHCRLFACLSASPKCDAGHGMALQTGYI